jgi:regulator of protease activity HflC (stomatin/prohibitin superfamily)
VQKAQAESIKLINEAAPEEGYITLKKLEAFGKAADGQATKVIIPSEIQGVAGLAEGVIQTVRSDEKKGE